MAKDNEQNEKNEDILEVDSISVSNNSVYMKRSLGLWSGTSLIVGTMVGSGIFISPTSVLLNAGSVGLSLICWTICGLISLIGALCMAELGTLIKKSGGDFAYLFAAFGPIPAFLSSWVSTLLMFTSSVAVIALTCAEYVVVPVFQDGCGPPPAVLVKLTAILISLFLTWVNCKNVTLASRVNVTFTLAKTFALVIIILGGLVKLIQGTTEHISTGFEGSETSPGKIAMGIYSGMWAYTGWGNLNYVTEEIINPEKNLPRSIILAVSSVTVLYLLVNVSYMTVLSVPEILASPAVAITWADTVIPTVSWLMPLFVAFSTFGATNGTLFAAGRLTFVTAREGHMMQMLAMVHIRKFSPPPSIIFTTFIAVFMIVFGDILSLIDFFGFTMWLFLALNMASLLTLRYKMADEPRAYKVPLIMPVTVIVICLFLLIAPLVQNPQIEFLYATAFILAGLIFYVPFVYYKLHVPGLDTLTIWIQLLMQVVPEKRTD